MKQPLSRRTFGTISSLGVASQAFASAAEPPTALSDTFPTQSPELVREMVTVAHGNFKRVRELVEARPSLAKASWDWGFGDWEDALGAASHMGNRPLAEYLIEHGARPSIFSAAMLGQLDVVKAFVAAQPGVQRIAGPHSISLLAHAQAGGTAAAPVLSYLESLGDAGAPLAVPLSQNEMTRLTGAYIFGARPNDRLEVTVDRGQLLCTRTGTMGRPLIHLGDHTFYPVGAAAVRIRFGSHDGKTTLSVHDPDLVLTAIRAGQLDPATALRQE